MIERAIEQGGLMRFFDSVRRRTALAGAALLCTATGFGSFAEAAVVAGPKACGEDTLIVSGGAYELGPGAWNTAAEMCVFSEGGAKFTLSKSALTESAIKDGTAGPGAYPYIKPAKLKESPIPVSALGDATSTWHTTNQDINGRAIEGKYNTAYDLWFSDREVTDPLFCHPQYSDELMIWLNARDVQPYGSTVGTVDVGGADYRVSAADVSPSHQLVNYQLSAEKTDVDHLNLRLFAIDGISRGLLPRAKYLCGVSAGFEVWENGTGLTTDSFSFEPVTGLPVGAITAGIPGRCVDNLHSVATDGNPVVLHPCNGTDAQKWTFGNDGTLRVQGKCLRQAGGQPGSRIEIGDCTDGAAKWRPGDAHALVNTATGLCLDDPDSSTDWAVQLQLHPCNGTPAQQFRLPYNGAPISGGLTHAAGGTCLTADGTGTPAALSSCTYSESQIWTLGTDGTLRAHGKCLQPAADPSQVALTACGTDDPAQKWVVHPSGHLSHSRPNADGLCLDTPDGVQLRLTDCRPATTPTWYLPA